MSPNFSARIRFGMQIDIPLASDNVGYLRWREYRFTSDWAFYTAFEAQNHSRVFSGFRRPMKVPCTSRPTKA